MTCPAQGCIHVDAAVAGGDGLHGLFQQHGLVCKVDHSPSSARRLAMSARLFRRREHCARALRSGPCPRARCACPCPQTASSREMLAWSRSELAEAAFRACRGSTRWPPRRRCASASPRSDQSSAAATAAPRKPPTHAADRRPGTRSRPGGHDQARLTARREHLTKTRRQGRSPLPINRVFVAPAGTLCGHPVRSTGPPRRSATYHFLPLSRGEDPAST